MNKKLIPLITLCLIKNCLLGGIEYYNTATKANVKQKEIEQLEIELFPKDIRDKYNFFTNPSRNFQAKAIKTRFTQKQTLTPQKVLEYYNDYIYTKIVTGVTEEKIKKFLQEENTAYIIKYCLLPYSSFYLGKLLGQPIEICKNNFHKNLENIKKSDSIVSIASDFLIYIKNYTELNIIRHILSDLLSERTSCQIHFEHPNQSTFAFYEIFIAHILNEIQELNHSIYVDFTCFYSQHFKKGLLLAWEAFWSEQKEQAKRLKKIIKKNAKEIKSSFYNSIKTMPQFKNIGDNLQETFHCVFNKLNECVFTEMQNLLEHIFDDFMNSDNFSLVDILFANGILYYPAKLYLAHEILPIHSLDIVESHNYVLFVSMKLSVLVKPQTTLPQMLMHQNANDEFNYSVKKLKDAIAETAKKLDEKQKGKDEINQFLDEKKAQAAKHKQQPKTKEQKTLSDLDDVFGVDKSNDEVAISFEKTVITEEDYKALLEQACSTGNVMQHGSHATMRMTMANENGEERQIQVQGYKKHGSAMKKGGKEKKTYAVLEKKQRKDQK